MSDCGVCIGYDLDDAGIAKFYRRKIMRARKQHTCCECRGTIATGEQYEYVRARWCDGPASYKTCLPCASIRDGLDCGSGAVYHGQLWEEVGYVLPDLKTACLKNITLPAGRQKLLDRRNEWRFPAKEKKRAPRR